MSEEKRDSIEVVTRVRYAETDQMGVAYYANHFIWFEVGRSEFCRQRGFSYRKLEEDYGLYLVVLRPGAGTWPPLATTMRSSSARGWESCASAR